MVVRAAADILVKINGDTKDLRAALKESDQGIKGLSGTMKGALIGGGFAAAGLAAAAFADQALQESERLRQGVGRLSATIGEDLAADLKESADDFAQWGLSAQDVLGLEGYFADVATSLGVAADEVADFAPDAAELAGALSKLNGLEVEDNLDAIAKAAELGSDDLAKLGIKLDEAEVEARALRDTGKGTAESLTDGERAAAAYKLIIEKLTPKLDDATAAQGGFGQKTDEVSAKWETLMGKFGEALEGPLDGILTWALNGISGWEALGKTFEKDTKGGWDALILSFGKSMPILGGVIDALLGINQAAKNATRSLTDMYQSTPNPDRRDGRGIAAGTSEAQVVAMIRDYERRNGLTIL